MPGKYDLRYVDIAKQYAPAALEELAGSHAYDFVCLNDVNTAPADQGRVAEAVHAFLEERFPFPSRYER